jgi:hypothetical protein
MRNAWTFQDYSEAGCLVWLLVIVAFCAGLCGVDLM